jgi:serine/threonine protein kinase
VSDSGPLDLFQRAREVGEESAESAPGLRRLGPYQLLGELGRGGFGRVYRASDELGREVALKVLIDLGQDRIERFRREAKATANLSHPNVLKIHSADYVEGQLFLVTELVPDCLTLDRVLSSADREQGLGLILAAGAGLAHAHERGLTHRDVKPGNLLVGSDGRLRVADFGLVLTEEDGRLTQTGYTVGTPRYMAPEQRAGLRRVVGPASDVWALGVIMYRFLAGVFPYADHVAPPLLLSASPPSSPRDYDATIPKALERVCLRALAPDPADRYPDAGAFTRDLSRALEAKAGAPKSLAVAVVLGVALVAGLSFGLSPSAPPPGVPAENPSQATTPAPTNAKAPQLDPFAPGLQSSEGLPGPPAGLTFPTTQLSPEATPPELELAVTHLIMWGGLRTAHDQLEALIAKKLRADYHLQRGRIRLELGRYPEARADFNAFSRRSPQASSYRNLGLALVCLSHGLEGNRGRSLESGARVVADARSIHPSFLRVAEFYGIVARSYLFVGATAEAEKVVQEGLGIFLQNPVLLGALADVYVDQGQLEKAREQHRAGIKLPKARGTWLLLSAETQLLVGARPEAAADAGACLEDARSGPEQWYALLLRCQARVGLGQLDAAEADLTALELGPPSWRVLALRARLCLARRDPAGARRALAKAEAGDTSLDLLRARLACLEGRYADSLSSLDQALAKGARPAFRGRALALRAFALEGASRRAEARAAAKSALELLQEPERALIKRLRALRSGEEKKAKEK